MVSVGADIVDIDEVAQALASFGERYLRRVFSEGEVDMCDALPPGTRTAWLAQCFAAKEAGLKLLRSLGACLPQPVREAAALVVDGVVDWRWIEVARSSSGCLELRLDAEARQAALAAGVSRVMVSVATSGNQAMAVAVAWPSAACTSGLDVAPLGMQVADGISHADGEGKVGAAIESEGDSDGDGDSDSDSEIR